MPVVGKARLTMPEPPVGWAAGLELYLARAASLATVPLLENARKAGTSHLLGITQCRGFIPCAGRAGREA